MRDRLIVWILWSIEDDVGDGEPRSRGTRRSPDDVERVAADEGGIKQVRDPSGGDGGSDPSPP